MRKVSIDTRLRRAAAAMTVFLLTASGSLLVAPSAQAAGLAGGDPPPHLRPDVDLGGSPQPERYRSTNAGMYGPGLWHHAPAGRTWYGGYFSLPGSSLSHAVAYCIDAGLKSPYPQYFTRAEGKPVTSAETAWALSQHGTADDAGVQAALAAMARLDESLEHDHAIAPAEPGELGAEFAKAAEAYAHITKDAADLAGPYRVELSLAEEPVLDGPATPLATPADAEPAAPVSDGPLTARISVLAAAGEALEDIPLEVEVTGGSVEDSQLRSAAEPLSVSVTPDRWDAGDVTVTVTASDLPATEVVVYDPVDPKTGKPAERVQSIVTAGEPTAASATASHRVEPAPPTGTVSPPTVPPIESPPPTTAPPTDEPTQVPTDEPTVTTPPPATMSPPTTEAAPPPEQTTPPEAKPEPRSETTPPPPPRQEAPPADELPRTGPIGADAALGSALLLLGCGVAAITVARGLKRD